MTRVMVTGGSGFIGTNVVESLCRDGHEVLNIDIAPPRCSAHAEFHRQADIRDKGAMARAIDEFSPAQIVHLAAEACVFGTSLEFFDANTTGVRNLDELLRERPAVERCIFASTKLVFPNGYKPKHINDYCPDTLYGRSKVIGEQIVHEAGDSLPCTWCIVRPTSIWGPWFESGYLMFVRSVARGRYWHLGKADPPRSFGYVGNVVYQLRALLEAPPEAVGGKTFYLSDYEQYRIRQWANYIARIEGRRDPSHLARLVRGVLRPHRRRASEAGLARRAVDDVPPSQHADGHRPHRSGPDPADRRARSVRPGIGNGRDARVDARARASGVRILPPAWAREGGQGPDGPRRAP